MKPTEIGITVEQEVGRMPSYEEATILFSPESMQECSKYLEAIATYHEGMGNRGVMISIHMLKQLSKQLRYASEKLSDG